MDQDHSKTDHNLPAAPVDRAALFAYLDDMGFQTSTVDHAPLFTVADSQALCSEIKGGHTKNLFLKDKKDNYFLLTAQEETEVNLKTLHKLLGAASRLSFGKADKMEEFLGVKPGAVTAFSVINDRQGKVRFALDARLLDYDIINCHPLANDATTSIRREDLLTFAKLCDHDPLIVDLAAEAPSA